ncbi:MAG: RnfABCDGE type electron transport complex subunit D [Bacteroidota bacterium]
MSSLSLSLPNIPDFRLLKDARHFQIIYLGSFLLYGIFALGWQANLVAYAVLISICLFTQFLFLKRHKLSMQGLKSAMITALGLCLLCKSSELWVMGLAAFIAISSKFLIRYKDSHLFNPANIGIKAAILLTGKAWVSPGQWGSDVVLLFMMGAAAFIVLLKVGRIDTSLGFLFSFGGLIFIEQVIYKGWPLDHFFHSLSSGTLLLFTFFMITDPKTTPRAPKARIIWALIIGVFTYILSSWFYTFDSPIWALIIVSPLTVFLNKKYGGKPFHWIKQSSISYNK